MFILEKVQAQYLKLKKSKAHFMQLQENMTGSNLENVKVGMCERMKVQNSESLTVQI